MYMYQEETLMRLKDNLHLYWASGGKAAFVIVSEISDSNGSRGLSAQWERQSRSVPSFETSIWQKISPAMAQFFCIVVQYVTLRTGVSASMCYPSSLLPLGPTTIMFLNTILRVANQWQQEPPQLDILQQMLYRGKQRGMLQSDAVQRNAT